MSEYIAQWTRKGDGPYDPVNYAKVEASSKKNALTKASKLLRNYTAIDILIILTMKEYGEHMSDRLTTIE